jgi:N-6 DNA Methylase
VSGLITSANPADRLVSATEIAELAGVTPSAVSNWRKRFPDFPAPVGTGSGGGDLFAFGDVERWAQAHGRPWRDTEDGTARVRKGGRHDALQQVWAVADQLRGIALAGDLMGAVAAAATLVHVAGEHGQRPSAKRSLAETGEWANAAATRLEVGRPELARLFAPLATVDPHSLGLLIDSLAESAVEAELAAVLDFVLERALRYGDFRTPEPVAELLTELAEPRGIVFDPAVGSGQFLIKAAQTAHGPLDLYGQELNESTWRIAVARLLLRDLDAEIQIGDSITLDRFPALQADLVLCEPPSGGRTTGVGQTAGDSRWQLLGTFEAPPPRASDFTWLAHVIHHLAPDGRGYVLLPTGSLFRGGVEARFRSELLRLGAVEAIIALPGGTTAATAAAALWIVRRPTPDPAPVLLVDGTGETALNRRLRERVVQTVRSWRRKPDEFQAVAGFARSAAVLEVLGGEAALIPSRWLYEPEVVEPTALAASVEQARSDLADMHADLALGEPRFTVLPATEPAPRLRVRDLIDLNLLQLVRPARIKTDKYNDEGYGLPVWLPSDVNDPWRRDEDPRFIDPALVDSRSITEARDIVLTTIGGIRTRVDEEGGHVLGTSLQALRLKADTLDPHALAALLTSEPNRRMLTGATIPRVNILELEIPRLDAPTATRFAELLRQLEDELRATYALASCAEALRTAVVDAIATGATTIEQIKKTNDD